MTGIDLAESFRGRYDSLLSATAAIRLYTGGSRSVAAVAAAAATAHGIEEIDVRFAQRGDMVLMRRPRDYSLGIVSLDGGAILIAGARGWGRAPRTGAIKAWRI